MYRWIVDHGWRGSVSDVDMILSKMVVSSILSVSHVCTNCSRWRKLPRDPGPSSTLGYLIDKRCADMLTLDHLVMAKEADQCIYPLDSAVLLHSRRHLVLPKIFGKQGTIGNAIPKIGKTACSPGSRARPVPARYDLGRY